MRVNADACKQTWRSTKKLFLRISDNLTDQGTKNVITRREEKNIIVTKIVNFKEQTGRMDVIDDSIKR